MPAHFHLDGAAHPWAQSVMERGASMRWPGGVAKRPRHLCEHPNRHEFYCWRSQDDAHYERDLMAGNPHYARLYVSEVYAGKLGGWAWAVCWTCPRLAD